MEELKSIITTNAHIWQLGLSERIFVTGLVSLMRPIKMLELGVWMGIGSTHFRKYCKELYRIDVMKVDTEEDDRFYNMRSDDAFKKIMKEGLRFDLTFIDADHSEEQAEKDMDNAMHCSDIIIMHDTFNEPCRKGYVKAIAKNQDKLMHIDFDVIHGNVLDNGEKWGGIGLIITTGMGVMNTK